MMLVHSPFSTLRTRRLGGVALGALLALGAAQPATAASQTFTSIATHDGRVRELTEFAGIGGVLDATDGGASALRVAAIRAPMSSGGVFSPSTPARSRTTP